MKVLVTTGLYPPEIGGPATYSKLLYDALPDRGIAVQVLPYRLVRNYWNAVRQIMFAGLVWRASFGVDVLYAQDTASVGWPTYFANLFLWKKFVVRVPGDHVWEQGTQRFGIEGTLDDFPLWSWSWSPWLMLIRTLQLVVVRRAHHVVVPSQYLARIVEGWGVTKEKISVIYNGVHVGDIGARQTIRGMLHFEGRLIISVGRLVPWKGFDALIKVFSKIKKKFPDTKLFIVGNGPELERLEAVAHAEKVHESVIFAGAVDHDALLRYVKASDIFVLNTSYEGLSHLVLETLAVGVPVVTTRVGGNPEVITDSVDGYLVKPNDVSALQSRITTLLEKPDIYARIVDAGRARAAAFTDTKVVDQTATLLKGL